MARLPDAPTRSRTSTPGTRHLEISGYHVVTDLAAIPRELRGLHPDNPVNRVAGVQLEPPTRVRGLSPRSPLPGPGPHGLSPVTSALVDGLTAAARNWQLRSAG